MAMLNLRKDLREFIELLNSHDVKYVVVGGYAVAYHGHPRNTGDIDIFVEISHENASRIESVIGAFGFRSLGLSAKDFTEPKTIIQLGYPPNRIDIITTISGIDFDRAWEGRVIGEDHGLTIPFVGKAALLENKAATGRPQYLKDIEALT